MSDRILRLDTGRRRVIVVAIVLFIGIVGTLLVLKGTAAIDPTQVSWRTISWRAQLFLKKAEGELPDLSWAELWEMSRRQGGFGLQEVIADGKTLAGAIDNPYVQPEDQEAARRIFRENCAICHGADGAGLSGPPLNKMGYKTGDSSFSSYKVLRDGIPGTPMASTNLSLVERWQVVGYLKLLQARASGSIDAVPLLKIPEVTSEQIAAPEKRPGEWLSYSGSLDGWRHSPLTEITPANVSQLRLRWVQQFDTGERKIESTPIVVGGTVFMTQPPATVVALDARSGRMIWTYSRSLPARLPICCGFVNRGLAISGHSLFFGSIDGYLVAIDVNTGKTIWQSQVARPSEGYSLTGAPLVVNRAVIVGVAGGEFGTRGFLAAFDIATGESLWKFDTVPGPGEVGHETWENDAWKTGGGPTWVTGSYDPGLDLLFWGVGNPSPNFLGDVRPGDNLFTNSVVALHASTGKLAWHFQFTPHDEHDWDSTQTPILADIVIKGANRKVICWPNRNGFYYVLDRTTGEFLTGRPFVEQNWTEGLDPSGRPIRLKEDAAMRSGRLTKPSVGGGTNWQPAAFDPRQSLVLVHATEGASVFTKAAEAKRAQNGTYLGSGGGAVIGPLVTLVRAIDAATGERRWEYRSPQTTPKHDFSGLLMTAGGVVFGASGGVLFALDAATGTELWSIFLGEGTYAAPISFSLDGRQLIAVSVGRAMYVFGL